MKRRWYGRDTGLAFRMFIVMFLLAAVYLFFLATLWFVGLDYFSLAIIAAVMLGAQYFLSDKLALWSVGARVVSREQAPDLHAVVERLTTMADLPKPRLAIVNSAIPNAFATGRNPKNSVIAVTTGLMERLDPAEIQAVLAHELSHIRNRDVAIITLASFFATVAQFIMRSAMFGGYGARGRRGRGMESLLVVYLVSIVVWLVSYFLIRALSRYRELAADRGSAIITGAPAQLASALIKISGTMQRTPQKDLREVEGMNAFFIVPALSGSSFMELFSTHPSLEKRLDQLKQLERDLETGV